MDINDDTEWVETGEPSGKLDGGSGEEGGDGAGIRDDLFEGGGSNFEFFLSLLDETPRSKFNLGIDETSRSKVTNPVCSSRILFKAWLCNAILILGPSNLLRCVADSLGLFYFLVTCV